MKTYFVFVELVNGNFNDYNELLPKMLGFKFDNVLSDFEGNRDFLPKGVFVCKTDKDLETVTNNVNIAVSHSYPDYKAVIVENIGVAHLNLTQLVL